MVARSSGADRRPAPGPPRSRRGPDSSRPRTPRYEPTTVTGVDYGAPRDEINATNGPIKRLSARNNIVI